MRQILSGSLLIVAAASSILAVTGASANADSDAKGVTTGSPGVLSGNSIQAPVDVPVNACGNTTNVAAADNAASGNRCANESHAHSSAQAADTDGQSVTTGSPGLLAGNSAEIPVHMPVNACGDSVNAAALLNPAMGNSCGNWTEDSSVSEPPPWAKPPSRDHNVPPASPVSVPSPVVTDSARTQLAESGIASRQLGTAGAASAALLLGGAILYRRRTSAAQPQKVPGRHAARPQEYTSDPRMHASRAH